MESEFERLHQGMRRALGRTLVIRVPEGTVDPGNSSPRYSLAGRARLRRGELGRGTLNLNLAEIHMSDEKFELPDGNTLSDYMKCVEILAGGHDVRRDDGDEASPEWWDAFNSTRQRWPEQSDLMGDIRKQNAAWAREQADWPSDQR